MFSKETEITRKKLIKVAIDTLKAIKKYLSFMKEYEKYKGGLPVSREELEEVLYLYNEAYWELGFAGGCYKDEELNKLYEYFASKINFKLY